MSIQTQLEPAVQTALMAAIQEVIGSPAGEPFSGSPASLPEPDPLPALASELDRLKDERHQIQQRCHELNNQVRCAPTATGQPGEGFSDRAV